MGNALCHCCGLFSKKSESEKEAPIDDDADLKKADKPEAVAAADKLPIDC